MATRTAGRYPLSLHDALPISGGEPGRKECGGHEHNGRDREREGIGRADFEEDAADNFPRRQREQQAHCESRRDHGEDRKSTRLNSSHSSISYAVFCLKKKKKT